MSSQQDGNEEQIVKHDGSSSSSSSIKSSSSLLERVKPFTEQHHLIPKAKDSTSSSISDSQQTASSSSRKNIDMNNIIIKFKIDENEFTTNTHRILSIESSPKLHYSDENKRNRNALHWGQRKLLLSEIEFLTQYSLDGDVVIYAGAAPGNHLAYLAEVLFPNLKFMLVDPNKFNEDLYHIRNVSIMQSYFTNEIAQEIKKLRNDANESNNLHHQNNNSNQLLFLSDIRTADPLIMDPEQNEQHIMEDLSLQKGWLEIFLPRFSMLKFRLPFTEGKIKYFKGDVYLPVWGRKWTTECRLVIKEDDIKSSNEIEYDNLSFSDQLFYFNNVTRFEYIYPHGAAAVGVDNCYDCRSEILILQNFIKKFPQRKKDIICSLLGASDEKTINNDNEIISLWMSDISHQISTKKRTLVHMPESFTFGPTIHLHPQQQSSQEWLDMRNMVLERTKHFSSKRRSSQSSDSQLSKLSFEPSHEISNAESIIMESIRNSPQLDELDDEQIKKKRRRRRKKPCNNKP